MSSMGSAEGIHDEKIEGGRKLLGKSLIILLLFSMKSEILKNDEVFISNCRENISSNTITNEMDWQANKLMKTLAHRKQGIFLFSLAIRAAKVRTECDMSTT
jgi:hypothetical protein